MSTIYPWQTGQWQQIVLQKQKHKLPYALLLEGVPGVGKKAFASAVAQFLLCESPLNDQSCEQCKSCLLWAGGSHPDFFKVNLEEKSQSIKIHQIRQLCDSLSQTAHQQQWQIAWIREADRLNHSAANALLKTLEEPLGSVLILLSTSQRHRLPATISSRCQRFLFPSQIDQKRRDWLEQQTHLKAPQADLLLRIAQGAPLKALALVQTGSLIKRDQLLQHLIRIHKAKAHPLSEVNTILKHDLTFWLDVWISLVSDVIRLHLNVPQNYLTHSDRIERLIWLKQHLPLNALMAFEKRLLKSRKHYLTASGIQIALLLESLFLQWKELTC